MEKKNANQIRVYTSIPPMVPGNTRGTLHIKFPLLKWDCATPPPAPRLSVLLKWWGENTDGCVFKVPIEYKKKLHPSVTPSSARYNIVSSWKQFQSYLQDMGHLTVTLGLGRTADDMLVIGECTIPNLVSLTPDKIERRNCSVVTNDRSVHLGQLVIEMLVKMKSSSKTTAKKNNSTKSILTKKTTSQSPIGKLPVHKPVQLLTVPISNKNWKPVGQVKLDSEACKQVISNDQSEQVPLSDVAKVMITDLIGRCRALHTDMVLAINDGIHSDNHRDTEKTPPRIDIMEKTVDEILENSMGAVDVTPPLSPTDSMLEAATLLSDVNWIESQNCHDNNNTVNHNNQPFIETGLPIGNRNQAVQHQNNIQTVHHQNEVQTLPFEHRTEAVSILHHSKLPLLSLPEVDCSSKDPELFHILLEISKGSGIYKSSDPVSLPNIYIQCRLFCLKSPINTKVFHGTQNPTIDMKQILPVCMRWNELLEYLERGYAILEVWDSCRKSKNGCDEDGGISNSDNDELIGLVKISLYPFYAAVWSSLRTPDHKGSLFPVVAIDSCCPIRDPFTGSSNGHIDVKLTMGTPTDIPAKIAALISDNNKPSANKFDICNDAGGIDTTLGISRDSSTGEESEEDNELVEIETDKVKMADTPDINEGYPVSNTLPVDDKIEVDLLISQALHLSMLSTPLGSSHCIPPSVYVTCHPHPSVSRVCTDICNNTTEPQWGHHCTVHIPRSFLVGAALCELEFQVWSLPPMNIDDNNNNPLYSADPKSHIFLGRAFIDLIPLLYGLRTIVGWYNIMDLAGELHGQIKIAVTPRSIIPRRMNGKCNNSNCYQSLLPVEIELCSTYSNYITVTTSGSSWCDKTFIEQYKNGEQHSQTLSILKQQLQSHVTDLEIIQDSLEAKLRDHSSIHTATPSLSTPCVTTISLHPITTDPVPQQILEPTHNSSSIKSPNHSNSTHYTSPNLLPLTTMSAPTSPDSLAVYSEKTSTPVHATNTSVVKSLSLNEASITSNHTSNNTTDALLNDDSTTEYLKQTMENEILVHVVDSAELNVEENKTIIVEELSAMSENGQDTSKDLNVSATQELLNNTNEANLIDNNNRDRVFDNVNDQPQNGGDESEDQERNEEMGTSVVESGINGGSNETTQQTPLYIAAIEHDDMSTREESYPRVTCRERYHVENSRDSDNDISTRKERYPRGTCREKYHVETCRDSDEDILTDVTSDSFCSSELQRKLGTLNDQTTDEDSRTSEDTSVLVDTSPPKGHAPVISDDDLVEEEEVKKLFSRLLKERHLSDLSSCSLSNSDGGESQTTTIEQLSEPEDSTDDNESLNETMSTAQPQRYSQPASFGYGMSKTQLTKRLLDIRRSANGRLPPRPIQSDNDTKKDCLVTDHLINKMNVPRIKTPERDRLARIFHS